jgi:hypothetical protein
VSNYIGSPQAARRSVYAVAGLQLWLESTDEWSAGLFERCFAGWHFAPSALGQEPQSSFTIKVSTGTPPPPIPHGFEQFETNPGELCCTDGKVYFLTKGGSAILIHPQAESCLEVWIGDSEEDREPSALERIVFNAIGAALRRCGLFELHSGGVIEPETGAGVLFVGPSGSGKSTLTMQLAAGGWSYMSDDLLLLREEPEGVIARGLRRFFAATEDSISACSSSAGQSIVTVPAPSKPHKRRFEPEQLFPHAFAEEGVPRALLFMSLTPQGDSYCEEIAPNEVITRLMKMYPWSCYDRPVAQQYLRVFAQLAKQCAAFDLYAGRDLLDDPARARSLIASCVRKSVR